MVPADLRGRTCHEFGAGFRRQMFEHHAQRGKLLRPFGQPAIDESRLTIENIDVVGDFFAMHQERHVDFLHALKYPHHVAVIGHAGQELVVAFAG